MEETKPIRLSFCIPTLNRGSFIGETLESIVSQATEEVEIVIVDGGSTDNTEEVVRQYQKRFPRLRYVPGNPQKPNAQNSTASGSGFDRDCSQAVELAEGEYCWLFTDDDLVNPGAIAKVLEATRHRFGLIIVNAEVKSPALSKLLRPRLLPLNSDRIYEPTDSEQFFIDVANYLSFMGGAVIRKKLWNERNKEPYFDSLFIHVGVIFQIPLTEQALVVSDPLISIRYGNAKWTSKRFDIWMFRWPDLVWSFPHYSDSAKSRVYPRAPWCSIKTLLLLRAQGAFSEAEYSRLKAHLGSWQGRLAARVVAWLPGGLLNLLGVFYCSVVHPGSKMALVDLLNSPYYSRNRAK